MTMFGLGNLVDRRKVETEIATGEREKKMPAPKKSTGDMTREERGAHWDEKLGRAAGAVARNLPTSDEVIAATKKTAGQIKDRTIEVGKAVGEAAMALPKAPSMINRALKEKGYGLGDPSAEAQKPEIKKRK
jgi:flagellar hook-basal body complex protein FliE